MAREENVDIMMVQEPYTVDSKVAHMNRLSNVIVEKSEGEVGPWACLVSLNDEYVLTMVTQVCTAHCVCVHILGPTGEFYVVSLYCQLSRDISGFVTQLDNVLAVTRGKNTIIGMDSNSVSALWSFGQVATARSLSRNNGLVLEDLVAKHGLMALNVPGQPCTSVNGVHDIDVTLVTGDLREKLRNWKVWDGRILSDHRPITFSLEPPEQVTTETIWQPRFNTRAAKWWKFGRTLRQKVADLRVRPLNSREDVESFVESLTAAITGAATCAMPLRKRHRKSVPWWTTALTEARREVNRVRRAFQVERDPDERDVKRLAYRSLRRDYTRAVRNARRTSWRNLVETEGNRGAFGLVYRLASEKVGVKKALETLKVDGAQTVGWRDTVGALLDGLFGCEPVERMPLCQLQPTGEGTIEWTESDVGRAVRAMKRRKAPGLDRVEVEHVVSMTKNGQLELLTKLYNACLTLGVFPACWKQGYVRILLKGKDKDPTKIKSYRPICLLSVLSKVLERLVCEALRPLIMDPRFASSHQYAYRKGRGTVDAIDRLRGIVSAKPDRMALAVFFDISGAFDNLAWNDVLAELHKRGCPAGLFGLVKDYFAERSVTIVEEHGSVVRRLSKGCPQGSILGPECWNMCLDELLKELEVMDEDFVAYADDLVIVVSGGSRGQLERRAQAVTDTVARWCTRRGLTLSESKTEMMLLKDRPVTGRAKKFHNAGSLAGSLRSGREKGLRPPSVKLNGKGLRYVTSVKYLGVTLEKGPKVSAHVDVVGDRAKAMLSRLMRVSRAGWGLPCSYVQLIYKAVYIPVVLYAAEVWGDLATAAMGRLESVQRFALQRICKAYCTCSTPALHILAGELPIELEIRRRMKIWRIKRQHAVVTNDRPLTPEERAEMAAELNAVEDEAIAEWNNKWQTTTKGAVTKLFFPTVQSRLGLKNLRLNHYTTQFMTGHGNFRAKLHGFGLKESGDCPCGMEDTATHELFVCESFSEEREDLIGVVSREGGNWPVACEELVQNQVVFKAFETFCVRVGVKKEGRD
ncbi:hypothetical protein TKK_0011661 [Trichogramma kaykai]